MVHVLCGALISAEASGEKRIFDQNVSYLCDIFVQRVLDSILKVSPMAEMTTLLLAADVGLSTTSVIPGTLKLYAAGHSLY